jgi:hypothetical protein
MYLPMYLRQGRTKDEVISFRSQALQLSLETTLHVVFIWAGIYNFVYALEVDNWQPVTD